VIVCAGDLPTPFLKEIGVQVRHEVRHRGSAIGKGYTAVASKSAVDGAMVPSCTVRSEARKHDGGERISSRSPAGRTGSLQQLGIALLVPNMASARFLEIFTTRSVSTGPG